MKTKHITILAIALIGILALAACGSDSDDVPSLRDIEDARPADAAAGADENAADVVLQNEARMMAFTQCLRDKGIEVLDPVVDADGNVGKPEPAEGTEFEKGAMGEAWEACAEHLEGFTFEKKRVDVSEQIDWWVAVTTCLREKGYDVDDPTAETLGQWGSDFKTRFNFKDPAAAADYEECSGAQAGGGKGK